VNVYKVLGRRSPDLLSIHDIHVALSVSLSLSFFSLCLFNSIFNEIHSEQLVCNTMNNVLAKTSHGRRHKLVLFLSPLPKTRFT
jgi:hypothetical protein